MSAALAPSASHGGSGGDFAVNRFQPQYGPRLMEAVLLAVHEANESAELESFAATKIQAVFRMYRARTKYLFTMKSIARIQSIVRGYVQGRQTERHRALDERRRQLSAFSYYATRIQACFRGYYSRKHKNDFYATKRYICEVTQRSNTALAAIEVINEEQERLVQLREATADYDEYVKATRKSHYLLSTASASGVYRPPIVATHTLPTGDEAVDGEEGQGQEASLGFAGTRTVFHTSVEDDIRASTALALGPELARTFALNSNAKLAKGALASCSPFSTVAMGDGTGAGVGAVSGGLTVGGVPEDILRKERHARRLQYSNSVHAYHYPKASKDSGAGEGGRGGEEEEEEGEVEEQQRGHGASAGPARASCSPASTNGNGDGARVTFKAIGSGTTAGFLPPIRPANSTKKSTTSSSSSSANNGTAAAGPLQENRLSSSYPSVPWENADALPLTSYALTFHEAAGGGGGGRVGGSRKTKKGLAVSSRNKAFHVPAHDCYGHVCQDEGEANAWQTRIDNGASTVGGGVEGAAGAPVAVTTTTLVNQGNSEQPLYDKGPASLQRAVDAKVRHALHGNAAFKV